MTSAFDKQPILREPYFEAAHTEGTMAHYPFSCFIQHSSETSVVVDAHWHYAIEMLYMLEGSATAILGGASQDFAQGDLILINGREVHAIVNQEGMPFCYQVIKFEPTLLFTTERTLFESKYILPFSSAGTSRQKRFSAEELACTPLPGLLAEILQETRERTYGYELAVRTAIGRIFLWIIRSWERKGIQMDAGSLLKEQDVMRLQQVFDYLDSHYQEDITAKTAADLLNMSYSYFSRYFRSVIGRTFTDALNTVRITEAERLLLTTTMNVTEIALETGFSSPSYFIRQFRRSKGMSPRHFRRIISGNGLEETEETSVHGE